jgi:multicomponent Na+:H+ antiporter subunit E
VSKIILHPKLPISPTLVRFKPTQRTDRRPGHARQFDHPDAGHHHHRGGARRVPRARLTREGAEGVIDSEMDRRVSACEGRP